MKHSATFSKILLFTLITILILVKSDNGSNEDVIKTQTAQASVYDVRIIGGLDQHDIPTLLVEVTANQFIRLPLPEETNFVNAIYAESPHDFFILVTEHTTMVGYENVYTFYRYTYNQDNGSFEYQAVCRRGNIDWYPGNIFSFIVIEDNIYAMSEQCLFRYNKYRWGEKEAENQIFVDQCKTDVFNIIAVQNTDQNGNVVSSAILKITPEEMTAFTIEEIWTINAIKIQAISYSKEFGLVAVDEHGKFYTVPM